jgi:hypothetical protein
LLLLALSVSPDITFQYESPMHSTISEAEAKNTLKNIARIVQARAVLAERPGNAMYTVVASLAAAVAVYAMSDFAAPMSVKVIISGAFVGALLSQIDAWFLQRRLEAVLVLLSEIEREDDTVA